MCGFVSLAQDCCASKKTVLHGSGAVVPDPRIVLIRRTMTATTDDLNKLHAMMLTKADEQDRKINVLQGILDRTEAQIKLLESEKKQAKVGHIHFGKDLCPDGFDGMSSEAFKAWKLKVVNYLSLGENNHIEEILEWAGKLKDKISTEIYYAEADEEDWDPDNHMTHHKFSKLLYRFLMAKTTDAANRIVQNGDAGNGVDAWRRLMFHYEPNLASITHCHLKAILAIPRAKDADAATRTSQQGPRRNSKYSACSTSYPPPSNSTLYLNTATRNRLSMTCARGTCVDHDGYFWQSTDVLLTSRDCWVLRRRVPQ